MKQTNETKMKKGLVSVDPVDQAHLDLGFVRAFIDMLFARVDNVGSAGMVELNASTLGAMCYESEDKLKNLELFLNSIPAEFSKKEAA